jgi:putative cyclase
MKATLLVALCALVDGSQAVAQTRENGPWWPNAQWGPGDQAGASNWITPDKVLSATALVKTGRVLELGHVYERGMPLIGNRSYNLFIPSFPTAGPFNGGNIVFNDEYVAAEIGQVGTQFDGPGHVGQKMKLADGTETIVFYNGATTEDMRDPYGLKRNGVENVKPILTRGIYIDLAAYKGVPMLPEQYVITVADVRGALARQGMKESDLAPGDALLFNLGWWKHWPKPISTSGSPAYASAELVEWIVARKPSMIGSDANFDGPDALVHANLTLKQGIFNLEFMNFAALENAPAYKFMFVFTPLRLKGATGSPGRPIAIL